MVGHLSCKVTRPYVCIHRGSSVASGEGGALEQVLVAHVHDGHAPNHLSSLLSLGKLLAIEACAVHHIGLILADSED